MALKWIKLLLAFVALWFIAVTWSCGEIAAKELTSAALD
jgi:hypothetical protein